MSSLNSNTSISSNPFILFTQKPLSGTIVCVCMCMCVCLFIIYYSLFFFYCTSFASGTLVNPLWVGWAAVCLGLRMGEGW